MIVSDVQQRDSAIHIHIPIYLPQTPFPSTLPRNIEQSSIYYTVDQLATFNLISYCMKTNQPISVCLSHNEFNFLLCVAEPAYEMTQEDSFLNCWQCVLGLHPKPSTPETRGEGCVVHVCVLGGFDDFLQSPGSPLRGDACQSFSSQADLHRHPDQKK